MALLSPMGELMVAIILAGVAFGAVGMPVAKGQWVAPVGFHGEAERPTPSIRTVGPKRGAVLIGQHGEIEKHTVVESDAKKSIIRSTRSKKSAVVLSEQDQIEQRGVAELEVSSAVDMPVAEGQSTAHVGPTRGAVVRSARPKSGTVPIGQPGQFERRGIAELEAFGAVGMPVVEGQVTAPVGLLHGGALKSTPSIRTVDPKRAEAAAIDLFTDEDGQIEKQIVTRPDAKKSIIRFARLKENDLLERKKAVELEAASSIRSTAPSQLLLIIVLAIVGILVCYCFALALLFQQIDSTAGSDAPAPGGVLGHTDEYGNTQSI